MAESEESLVARAQAGDNEAFDELASRHSTRLRRTLYRITRDCEAAYDAVQEALMRAWRGIGRFEGRSRFSTWLTRIGINEAYRGLSRPVEESLDVDDKVGERIAGWGNQPDRVFESREFLAAVEAALGGCRSTTAPRSPCATSTGSAPPRRRRSWASASGR